jgi:uncharacterized protein (DUF1697 family)
MNTYIALFRGINVGGKSTLPMPGLVSALEALGAYDIRTYIQSGNVVFRSPENNPAQLAARLSTEIGQRYGFEPWVIVLKPEKIIAAMQGNPFPAAEANPNSLHVGFLESVPPNPDVEKLNSLKADSEKFQLKGDIFYFYAPDGVGRSKLAATAEKALGVPMTDRNWRTVAKLREMAEG